ncbi:actin cortical patch SUR7/pH-response regulator pali [Fomitopsis serialis]|uniref:actin cortical patch SUR7/pH-response regulator pali n=1 Tax=Fomitopsis serialis TaxID=139415 RepID=UPI002008096E|nr:actin cortical patch SUR7/pH-response regulator pali [Neoantrodia serialis]KAH9934644.1 actin cortical patch SUR7/pH-response regulator pali [Neoantrodia serialis]
MLAAIFLFHLVGQETSSSYTAAGSAWFGVWGYCISPVDVSVLGTNVDTAASCSKAQLGYDLNQNILTEIGASALHLNTNTINKATSAVLVLHPIATGFAFLALVSSLFMVHRRPGSGLSRGASVLALISGILAALLATVVFLIDVIFVAVVRHRVRSESGGAFSLTWGNAVWMALGATIALWIALVGVSADVCCGRRYRTKTAAY